MACHTRPEVSEIVNEVKGMAIDGDVRVCSDVLSHDLGFLQADGESELFARS